MVACRGISSGAATAFSSREPIWINPETILQEATIVRRESAKLTDDGATKLSTRDAIPCKKHGKIGSKSGPKNFRISFRPRPAPPGFHEKFTNHYLLRSCE